MADWERSISQSALWDGCGACAHFRPDMTCVAFPRRIPIQIMSGEVDHLVVRPGQVGDFVFEPRETPVAAETASVRPGTV